MQIPSRSIDAANHQLQQAAPARMLQWAYEEYGSSLCFATMLDAEGCALVALLAAHAPQVPVLMPDTGYLSPQVLSLRGALQLRYRLPIRLIRPSLLAASFESEHGPLYQRHPSRCCRINRWEPIRGVLSRYTARIAARRRALCPAMQLTLPVAWDETLRLVQINPLAFWSDEDVQRYLVDEAIPHLSAHEAATQLGCAQCPQAWHDVVPSGADVIADTGGLVQRCWQWVLRRQSQRSSMTPQGSMRAS